ncbi:agmatinase family protein [Bdellovibrio sp. HCB288]|uniref:agmatinase family protein n=1 Tax=Bdellovibrio sp. HCB288 TaxID=3394355 RepID=UPI0039B623DD
MSEKTEKTAPKFDPTTTISAEFGIFGIPMTEEESKVVLVPVPWEVTTSYGEGASRGPQIIRDASEQIDLFDIEVGKAYEAGYHMRELSDDLLKMNDKYKAVAQELIGMRTSMSDDTAKMDKLAADVNAACEKMSQWVYDQCSDVLNKGKLLGMVGGDHSTPLGAIRAVSDKFKGDFGVLHIDAHADLRVAYQGFKQSHASIMYNVMMDPKKPKKLVQVGIRDFCEEEYDFSESREDIKTFYDLELKRRMLKGETWEQVCKDILKELPQNVYISFDIDGLDPVYCPHTGTPVPGGMTVDQIFFLFREIHASGRKLIAFDLNEVSTGGLEPHEVEWDGNVGARILYKMCGWLVKSNA